MVLPTDEAHTSLLDFLIARFPHISAQQWQQRFGQGKILNEHAQVLSLEQGYVPGMPVFYFRELMHEVVVPFNEQVLYEDELLLVVDKPHFLAVSPVGSYVEQTLLRRLQRQYLELELSPLHRLDRLTAGVMLLCKQPQHRDAYQQLFRQQRVHKLYEAIAAPLLSVQFPLVYRSCMQASSECFFLMAETQGEANSETHISVLARGEQLWHYQLQPITGKKHQLRVHMASLGSPILGDDFYPVLSQRPLDDFTQPLQLLAREIAFKDPVTGEQRCFRSERQLERALAL